MKEKLRIVDCELAVLVFQIPHPKSAIRNSSYPSLSEKEFHSLQLGQRWRTSRVL